MEIVRNGEFCAVLNYGKHIGSFQVQEFRGVNEAYMTHNASKYPRELRAMCLLVKEELKMNIAIDVPNVTILDESDMYGASSPYLKAGFVKDKAKSNPERTGYIRLVMDFILHSKGQHQRKLETDKLRSLLKNNHARL